MEKLFLHTGSVTTGARSKLRLVPENATKAAYIKYGEVTSSAVVEGDFVNGFVMTAFIMIASVRPILQGEQSGTF